MKFIDGSKELDFDFRVLLKENKITCIRQYPHKRHLTKKEVEFVNMYVIDLIDEFNLIKEQSYGLCFVFLNNQIVFKELQVGLYIPPKGKENVDVILGKAKDSGSGLRSMLSKLTITLEEE